METYNPQDMAQKIMDELAKERNKLTKLNVMVLGKTGVGKSTLINNVFAEPLCETGIGQPVTYEIKKYEKPGFPLGIYDCPGLELTGENTVTNLSHDIGKIIDEGFESGDPNKVIHCIWYCVNSNDARFENAEQDFLNRVTQISGQRQIPVIVVLTKTYSKKQAVALRNEINGLCPEVRGVIPVLAEQYDMDDDYTVKAFGLDKLIDAMNQMIPETVRNTLVAVQKVNIELKTEKARDIVKMAAAAAAAIGAIPIPFSDAVLLVPEQIAMLAKITAIFGVSIEESTLTSVITATVGTAGATVLGKSIVSGILKLIPGIRLVTSVISGGVAAGLTAALGEAYIRVMLSIVEGKMTAEDLATAEGEAFIKDIFQEEMSVKRDENGNPIE